MKPIKIHKDNADKIEAALKEVNRRAHSFAVTSYGSVWDFADDAETKLAVSQLPKKDRPGAIARCHPAGPSANAYKYGAKSTIVVMERRATGWFLTDVCETTVWPREKERIGVTITAKQRDMIYAPISQRLFHPGGTAMIPRDTLPNKLSALIKLALHDLEIVESKPHLYRIDFGQWHTPNKDDLDAPCGVCFAGAVLATSLHWPRWRFYTMNSLKAPDSVESKFKALDAVRDGAVCESMDFIAEARGEEFKEDLALSDDQLATIDRLSDVYTGELNYSEDADHFKRSLRHIAHDLEEVGL